MQFIIMTRGKESLVKNFIAELQKIMLPMWMRLPKMPGEEKTSGAGQAVQNMVQVVARPIQLWEIVFPKEHEDLIAASIFDKSRGVTNQKWLTKWFNLLRRLLHLEPINWNYRDKPIIPLPKDWVEVIGIGKKEDSYIKTDKEEHENL